MTSSPKKFNTIRLSKSQNYTRPKTTITDTLQEQDKYKEKLQNYEEVKDIDYVSIGTHVRYFVFCTKENIWKFRCGGLLTKKHLKYVVLSNGKHSWSVQREIIDETNDQVYETKFFKILSNDEKKDRVLNEKEKEIEILKQDNKIMAEKLERLIDYVKQQSKK